MKIFIPTLILLLSLLAFAERRALRVLPPEAIAAVALERASMRGGANAVTNWSVAIASSEITALKSNAVIIATRRMAYEDYAITRTGKNTNTVAKVQTARFEILEVQHVD